MIYNTGSEIRISVALVTRNRPEILERCLNSWRAQTVPPLEIVVSDDSDATIAPRIQELAARYDCVYVQGPQRGLYANRNSAAVACRGSHILTDDDDHTHPVNYVEKISELIHEDPTRVYTFGERRDPSEPDYPLQIPVELHYSGHGCAPRDPSNCSAISDGSTVYPRLIFDNGLRYDESYTFGTLWYLWGKVLVKQGWRISISDRTFVWNQLFAESERWTSKPFVENQLACMTYVSLVNAMWVNPSLVSLVIAFAYLLRRMIFTDSIYYYRVRVRISPKSALRAISLAWSYPRRLGRRS